MKVTFESKGDFEGALDFLKTISTEPPKSTLNSMGEEGVRALSANTPRDTGATANGWKYKVEARGPLSELSWYNSAHPNLRVNMAVLIENGHGTRNGGYVPPRPYINRSMDPLFKNAGDRLFKEMTK